MIIIKSIQMRHLFLLFALTLSQFTFSQLVPTGFPDQEFNVNVNGWIPNGTVNHVFADEENNKIWLNGEFSSINHTSYLVDWMDYDRNYPKSVLPKLESNCYKMVSDGYDGFFITGEFVTIGDSIRYNLAHLDSNYQPTSWQITWPEGVNTLINDFIIGTNNIYLQIDYGIIIVNKATGHIYNWNISVGDLGGQIQTFKEIGNYLYIGGTFKNLNVQSANIPKIGMAQINISDSSLTAWDAGLTSNNFVNCIEKENNQLFIGGSFSQILGQNRNNLASLTVNGSNLNLNSWNPNVNGTVNDLEISGNKIMIIGQFSSVASQTRNKIAYMSKNGNTVTSFNPGAALVPSGYPDLTKATFHGSNVIIQFNAENVVINGTTRNYLAAFDTTNYILQTWNPKPYGYAKVSSVYDRFYTTGSYGSMNEIQTNSIAAFDATTMELITNHPIFPINYNFGNGIYVTDNKLIAIDNNYLKYYDTQTGLPLTNTNFYSGDQVKFLGVHNDYLYLSELYTTDYVNVEPNNSLRRISLNTYELDSTFHPIISNINEGDGTVLSAVFVDSMIYFGGQFDEVNGIPRKAFAAINLNTFELDSFDIESQSAFIFKILKKDSLLLVHGDFNSIQNETRNGIAAVNINTGRINNWSPDWGVESQSEVLSMVNKNNHIYFIYWDGRILSFPIYDNQLSNLTVTNSYISDLAVTNDYLIAGAAVIGSQYNTLGVSTDSKIATIDICEREHLEMIEIYEGESYTWHGTTYTQTGVHYLSQSNPSGCDSIYILNLNVRDKFYVDHFQTVCDSFQWEQTNVTYNSSGYYRDTIYGLIDTIHVLHLTIYNSPQATFADTIYSDETLTWYGQTYSNTGVYTTTVPSNVYCDSVLTLNLVHFPYQYDTSIVQTCNQTYTWLLNNQTYNSSGVYFDTLYTSTFDTIFVLDLTIPVIQPTELYDTLFSSFSYYNFHGTQLNQSGFYSDTLATVNGCDSIVNLQLTVIPPAFDSSTITACNSYVWNINNQTFTQSGIYQDTVQFSNIDTIYVLNLTINSNPQLTILDTLESMYGSYNFYGIILNQPGNYTDTIPATIGCDTIVNLNLALRSAYYDTVVVTSCYNYLWNETGINYSNSGFYSDTIFGITVQDTIRILNLTINSYNDSTTFQTACVSFTWPLNNITYSNSGIYQDTIPNSFGCDTIVSLNLTIVSLQNLIVNQYTMPTSEGNCDGLLQLYIGGNADFEASIDNGLLTFNTSNNLQINTLCAGIHDLLIIDACGNLDSSTFVIPSATTFIYENSFPGIQVVDTLSETQENCDILYNTIDTFYIESIATNGNDLNVTWNVVDANGSHLISSNYTIENGNGAYFLQLNIFCPTKNGTGYFSGGEVVYFENGNVTQAGISSIKNQNEVLIYPNPTNSIVHLKFNGSSLNYIIRDAQGRFVKRGNITNNETISLENQERGIYFLELSNEFGKTTKSVVRN